MKNVFGIIGLKVYGLVIGVSALILGFAGVAESTRHHGVITVGQYRSLHVSAKTGRADVLLYFGAPATPSVKASESQLPVATKRMGNCMTYRGQTAAAGGYKFCFDPASDALISKDQVS